MQYPSVTVCVDSTYKIYIDELLYSNATLAETENIVKSNIWKRKETFYFVNQKYKNKDDFPCMTSSESNDPGKPCSFPFILNVSENVRKNSFGINKETEEREYHNCTDINSPQLWCFTKVDKGSFLM